MDGEIKTDNLFYYFWREVLNIQLYASQILEILKKIYWYSKFKHMIPNSTTSYLYGRSSQLNCITRRYTIAVTSRIHITRRTIDTRTAQLCIKPSLFLWIRAATPQEEGKGASLSRRISNDSFRRH